MRQKRRRSTLPSINFLQTKPQLDNSDLLIHKILPKEKLETIQSNQGKGASKKQEERAAPDVNLSVVTQIRVMKQKEINQSRLKLPSKSACTPNRPSPPRAQADQ